MSLVGTLAKIAIGAAIAKGVSSMSKGGASRRPAPEPGTGSIFGSEHSPEGGLGDILGGLADGRPEAGERPSGDLSDMLGSIMKGSGSNGRDTGGGLSDIFGGGGQSTGRQSANPGGELVDMLGKMLGGGKAAAGGAQGGLGGLLESLTGGGAPGNTPAAPEAGSLGDMLNDAFQRGGAPKATPTQAQEDQAALLLRAIIQAAKSDGRIDAKEKEALMQHLGDMTDDEARAVNDELRRPVDIQGLARDVPRGMEGQVYAMSLVGLDLDSQAEAKYLHALGQALGIDARTANAIHQKMGEPSLYG
ncbi:tellurite resistance TerB family protein [Aliiroseovarius sp. S1339]|uniref:DUF533 domain-containing protein n=1 Tax=Aliiroseovarius sp. S1339 TaxID=2936990 RepID=UPI0020BF5AD7|nr:DUF533 domain-containing protein [Aliiroseovarius sp. S1339]MCK8464343.1 tellurite resistance TerB family protein [Aliiroseovarius sp. S1339]